MGVVTFFVQGVLSPANTVNRASLADRKSVFSSGSRLLFRIPLEMVLLIRSGLGEVLQSRIPSSASLYEASHAQISQHVVIEQCTEGHLKS